MDKPLDNTLAVGMIVRSSDGERLGTIVALGPRTLQIEKGVVFPKEFTTTYDEIHELRGGEVILARGREALLADVKGTEVIEEKAEALLEKAKSVVVKAGDALHDAVERVIAPSPRDDAPLAPMGRASEDSLAPVEVSTTPAAPSQPTGLGAREASGALDAPGGIEANRARGEDDARDDRPPSR